MESLVQFLQSLDPLLICLFLFSLAFIENIFPPSPSDLMIVFGGALVAVGRVGFAEALLSATAGSVLGFVAMYKIGDWFGDHIIEGGKISFIRVETVRKVEEWFRKHGYWVIVVNRFLTGTRAVVGFFAGMSEMNLPLTILLCGVSAMIWNAILISLGYTLGENWQDLELYLGTYSKVVTGIIVLVIAGMLVRLWYKKRTRSARP